MEIENKSALYGRPTVRQVRRVRGLCAMLWTYGLSALQGAPSPSACRPDVELPNWKISLPNDARSCCEYVTGNGRYVGQRPAGSTRGLRCAQPSGHVGACTARRPVFSCEFVTGNGRSTGEEGDDEGEEGGDMQYKASFKYPLTPSLCKSGYTKEATYLLAT
eukprot:4885905-Prymnesium_polylepis.1